MASSFLFLSLPLELRCMVYAFYIADTTITYDQAACNLPNEEGEIWKQRRCRERAYPWEYTAFITKHLDSLSLTCKTIRIEFNEELRRISNTPDAPPFLINLLSPTLINWPTLNLEGHITTVNLVLHLTRNHIFSIDAGGIYDLLKGLPYLRSAMVSVHVEKAHVFSKPAVGAIALEMRDSLQDWKRSGAEELGIACGEWGLFMAQDEESGEWIEEALRFKDGSWETSDMMIL